MTRLYQQHRQLCLAMWLLAAFCLGVVSSRSFFPGPSEKEIWEAYLKTKSPIMVCRFVSPWNETELRQQIIDLLDWTVPKNAPLIITCVEDADFELSE